MPGSLDLATLQQCGMLTGLCFAAVFAGQWRGGRDRGYLLCWGGASLCHAAAIAGFAAAEPGIGILTRSLLYAAIAAGPLLIVAGVRAFDGRVPLARWMAVPLLLAATGHGGGRMLGEAAGIRLGAIGLAVVALAVAVALLRSRPDLTVDMRRDGRRLTGAAMLGYLPGYAWVAATGSATDSVAAQLTMVDQMLTIFVNLGLLAMPGRRARHRRATHPRTIKPRRAPSTAASFFQKRAGRRPSRRSDGSRMSRIWPENTGSRHARKQPEKRWRPGGIPSPGLILPATAGRSGNAARRRPA